MGIAHKNTASGGGVSNPSLAAETVVYTTPAIQMGAGEGPVGITGTLNVVPGTGTTAVVIRVRQGNVTGPLVGVALTHTVAAGAVQSVSFGATDTGDFLQQPGGGQYVVTAQQTGGTANGTTNAVDVEVVV